MNDIETGEVLDAIAAHYWPRNQKSADEQTLMVATWAEVFADIPREPHVNLALAAWFRSEKWPPQASELRDLALDLGGPTPAMIARANYYRAKDSHWTALCGLKHLSREERRQRQADFEAELNASQDLALVTIDAPLVVIERG